MKFTRTIALCALALALPLFIGWGDGKKQDDTEEIEKVVKVVKMAYDGGSQPDTAIIMAELAIFDLGKKGKIADAPAQLEKVLPQVKKAGLRNFTRFLVAASYGEAKNEAKAVETLQALIAENAPRVAAEEPK